MSKTTILIVEDEAIVGADLAGKLGRLGYEIAGIAAEGEEAVELALRLRPHLVLMDIQLEGPMDGIEAAEAIRLGHDVPVIYLTAHSDPGTLARAKLTGPFGYILKPFEERELAAQIEVALFKHQADRQLREQREWLRVTLTSIGDAVIATDAEGRVSFVNPVAESLTGWKAKEAIGRPIPNVFRIVNEQTGQAAEEPVARVLREGRAVALANHTALLTKDGRTVPIEDSAAPILDAAGQVIGAVLVFRDVTEKRRAEDALRESEEKFRTVFANAVIGFALATLDGRVVDANPAYCRLTGYDIEELRTLALPQLIYPDDVAENMKLIDRMVAGRITDFVVENRYLRKNGGVVWVRKSVSLVRNEKNMPKWTIALVEDVTERREAEKALLQLNETLEQKVAERTELAERRANQLQTLAIELIEAEERERRRVAHLLHDDLQQIVAAARFQLESACESLPHTPALAIVEQLLEESINKSRHLSHELSPPVLHHSDLIAALNGLARQMNEQFGLQVELQADAKQYFESAPLKLFVFRAVQELLFNVVKHADVGSARIALSGSDGRLDITVSDRGRGLDPEMLDSATAPAGFGLLALRERARHIGGDLVIQSAPGQGSRFTLTIPLNAPKVDETQQPSPGRIPITPAEPTHTDPPEGVRVLFADDHQVMRNGLIQLMAGQPNIQVVGGAADGLEALEQARRLKPDVVVMDVSMPKMDGIEATRRIKAELPEVRVIALSMHQDEHIARTMCDAGAEAFVCKTASSADLLKAIYGITKH